MQRDEPSATDPPIRVLVVDDHAVVRQGIRAMLESVADVDIVGEAADGQEAVERAAELRPDVVLMDLALPVMSGAEAIALLARRTPDSKVLILTGTGVDEQIFDALEAGALGYLAKTARRDEVLGAVRRLHRGEPSLPPELTRRLLERLGAPDAEKAGPVEPLTDRETEVLQLVAAGLSNRGIAERLGVSETTVRTHVSRILGKLEVANRVQAALYALRVGIASLDDAVQER